LNEGKKFAMVSPITNAIESTPPVPTPEMTVAARLLVQEQNILRQRARRMAISVCGHQKNWYTCRICKRSTSESDFDCAVKYGVRSYACCDCFVASDAHSVLAMPSCVVHQLPLSAFDSFVLLDVDESVIEIRRALAYVWNTRHQIFDLDAMFRRAEARESARDVLFAAAGIWVGDEGQAAYKRACEAVAGCDLVEVMRGVDPWSPEGRGTEGRVLR
jgi:hypothetical protein